MRYNIKTGIKHSKRKISSLILGLAALSFPVVIAISSGIANAVISNNYSLFGDAAIVSGGHPGNAAQIGNASGTGFGGVDYADTGATTVSQLNTLSTDYNFTQG